MHWQTVFLLCLLSLQTTLPAPVNRSPADIQAAAIRYLRKYFFIWPDIEVTDDVLREAIIIYQNSTGLPETGELDDATVLEMSWPRCDFENAMYLASYSTSARRWGSWRKTDLTYALDNYTPDMSQQRVLAEIERAFKVWSDVSGLTFQRVETNQRPDIRIGFYEYSHGDRDPFDGPGNTLAHAYFPNFGGNMHLDESETFTANTYRGINLFQVAAHELGHSLGLGHTDDRSALMYAAYRGYQPNFRLANDDIRGIQSLYGANQNNPNTPAPTAAPPRPRTTFPPVGQPDYCRDPEFDTLFTMPNGRTFAFRGNRVYEVVSSGVSRSRSISQVFPGLSGPVDAAVALTRNSNLQVWIFKGSRIYMYNYNGGFYLSGSEAISQLLPGAPNNIDTVFTWSGNDKIYITKGSEYWRVNATLNGMDPGYPRPLSVWVSNSRPEFRGPISNGITAADQYSNGKTYFFIHGQYYRLIDRPLKVDETRQSPYPRPVSLWWYGCRN